ncbi:MAG: glycosyl transferase [Pedobacter sp.]|nr:MAG: glycosyl transferase [Pedobacter sp.]
MKILYAIQGTGNGHVSRAREIVPLLEQYGELDLLISGTQADMSLAQHIKYKFHGFSFIFGKKGGVDHFKTWKTMDMSQFWRDTRKVPLEDYNLIINDFEPVTAWACRNRGIPCVGMSHQSSFISGKVPKPRSIDWAQFVLKYYAPAKDHVGFHFKKYDEFIYTPVIRSEIRALQPQDLGHYTVYLPALDDRYLVKLLNQLPHTKWEVFSKHSLVAYKHGNVDVHPINNEQFIKSLSGCSGLLTGGGFEGPAEALFLKKKLLVAPMKYQYEQQCNAYALKELGIPVLWGSDKNWLPSIKMWVNNTQNYTFDFPDETAAIVAGLVDKYAR